MIVYLDPEAVPEDLKPLFATPPERRDPFFTVYRDRESIPAHIRPAFDLVERMIAHDDEQRAAGAGLMARMARNEEIARLAEPVLVGAEPAAPPATINGDVTINITIQLPPA